MNTRNFAYFALLLVILSACSSKKNTVASRAYHNLTARFNGLYYSTVNLEEGIYKVEKNSKENYDKILPVFIYPSQDNVKSTSAEFEKAIKKSSLSIQKHAIKDAKGNEIPTAGKWIDNNWLNIGTAHFYKREFFSAIETFEYVTRTYNKSNDRFFALLWLIKANNEIGAVSTSETYLSLLKNERKLPHYVKNHFPVVYADYYIRRGQYTEAIAKLMEATRNNKFMLGLKKSERARYNFIVAQLSERQGDTKRAREYYDRTIRLKPNFEMVFYSKIKIARLFDVKKNNADKLKKSLLKMSKEFKNSDYYDVIFYTLGEIEEKQKNIPQALNYYNLSVRKSVNNPNQKALSFLKMAEINFDLTNYQPAEAYYDSTIATLPKDHPDYEQILARKKTLETLVKQIRTISREDSLQRIAKMSEEQRNKFIDDMIDKLEKEEERKQRELELAIANAANSPNTTSGNQPSTIPGMGDQAGFYFYSPNLVSFGIVDFVKKWGNRKNEDDWRRSGKTITLSNDENVDAKSDSIAKAKAAAIKKERKSRNFYMKDLPLSDSALSKSSAKMVNAYYIMGSVYKEELNNTKKTISTFEELNARFPGNKYELHTYYSLYRIYLNDRNTAKADYYKNKLLNEYPDSEFALLIKNPEYTQQLNARKSEVEDYYATVWLSYKAGNYSKALVEANEGISKYGKNDYLPNFEFIKAVSLGKLQGQDTLEKQMKLVVVKYPSANITPLAQEVLAGIAKQKMPAKPPVQDSAQGTPKVNYKLDKEQIHYVLIVCPDQKKSTDALRTNLANFNSVFFSSRKLESTASLFDKNQLVMVKNFVDAKDAILYAESASTDTDLFKNTFKPEELEFLVIAIDNVSDFVKFRDLSGYRNFFIQNYGALKTGK